MWITENLNHRDESTEVPICCALLYSAQRALPHHWSGCHSDLHPQCCHTTGIGATAEPANQSSCATLKYHLASVGNFWFTIWNSAWPTFREPHIKDSNSFLVGFMYSSHNYQHSCCRVLGEFLANHLNGHSWQRKLESLNLGMLGCHCRNPFQRVTEYFCSSGKF